MNTGQMEGVRAVQYDSTFKVSATSSAKKDRSQEKIKDNLRLPATQKPAKYPNLTSQRMLPWPCFALCDVVVQTTVPRWTWLIELLRRVSEMQWCETMANTAPPLPLSGKSRVAADVARPNPGNEIVSTMRVIGPLTVSYGLNRVIPRQVHMNNLVAERHDENLSAYVPRELSKEHICRRAFIVGASQADRLLILQKYGEFATFTGCLFSFVTLPCVFDGCMMLCPELPA